VIEAERETDLDEAVLKTSCPWNFDQIMSMDFWPGEATH
jgi:hypothetical protein